MSTNIFPRLQEAMEESDQRGYDAGYYSRGFFCEWKSQTDFFLSQLCRPFRSRIKKHYRGECSDLRNLEGFQKVDWPQVDEYLTAAWKLAESKGYEPGRRFGNLKLWAEAKNIPKGPEWFKANVGGNTRLVKP